MQDRWIASPKLTISYGMRYEIMPFSTDANAGDQSRYDSSNNTLLIGGYGPVNERLNVNTDYGNIGPRLGIAYRIAPKTVIRGGFGMFYTRFAQEYVLTTEEENGINTTSYTVANPGTSCNPSAPNLIEACGATSDAQNSSAARTFACSRRTSRRSWGCRFPTQPPWNPAARPAIQFACRPRQRSSAASPSL